MYPLTAARAILSHITEEKREEKKDEANFAKRASPLSLGNKRASLVYMYVCIHNELRLPPPPSKRDEPKRGPGQNASRTNTKNRPFTAERAFETRHQITLLPACRRKTPSRRSTLATRQPRVRQRTFPAAAKCTCLPPLRMRASSSTRSTHRN